MSSRVVIYHFQDDRDSWAVYRNGDLVLDGEDLDMRSLARLLDGEAVTLHSESLSEQQAELIADRGVWPDTLAEMEALNKVPE